MKYIIDIDALNNLVDLLPNINYNGSLYIPRDYIKELISNFPKDLMKNNIDEKSENVGYWEFWEGWIGNHDQRIEDATCSECGYKHPVVRRQTGENSADVLKKLTPYCPQCGIKMTVKN